jgi:TRAP-type C4-dicarboxylate transport system permease small subunit
MMDALSFIGALAVIIFALAGANVWLRYGFEGVQFVWSREFPVALHNWQSMRNMEASLERDRSGEAIQRSVR